MILAIIAAVMPVLVAAVDATQAYRSARDDPDWEVRWGSLDPAERAWLAVVATRRDWIASLSDPEEIRLARGRRRRELRRQVNFDLATFPIFLAAAALLIAEVIGEGALVTVFLGVVAIRGIWTYRRERQIKGAYRRAKDAYLETTAPA